MTFQVQLSGQVFSVELMIGVNGGLTLTTDAGTPITSDQGAPIDKDST